MPVLSDGAVLVRPHAPDDVDELTAAACESIADVSPWLPWCHPGYGRADAAAFIEFSRVGWRDRSHFQFLIVGSSTLAILGGISLTHIVRTNRLANMGYWVRTSASGRGIAPAAARLVAGFGFGELGLSRIEIVAVPENVRSRRVAEKIGARFEVIARNRLVMHGRPYDGAVYSLIPSDLAANGPAS